MVKEEQTTVNSYVGSLHLPSIDISDEGDYRCIVLYANVGYVVSNHLRVSVLGFRQPLYDVTVAYGGKTSLECITNYDGVTSWKRDDNVLEETGSVLVLRNVDSSSIGTYQCKVEYEDISLTSTSLISLSTNLIHITTKTHVVNIGDMIIVTCVTSYPDIAWTVNGVTTVDGVNAEAQSITVSNVRKSVRVQCGAGDSENYALSKEITVQVRGFIFHPLSTAQQHTESVKLRCQAQGYDIIFVEWASDDGKVKGDIREYRQINSLLSILTTYKLGVYNCLAHFSDNHVTSSAPASITPISKFLLSVAIIQKHLIQH